jgi:hypothetical protein
MARLVVLRFEDNEQAYTLLEDWLYAKERREEGHPQLLTPSQENNIDCDIVGVFAAPTKFCDPTDGHLGRGKIAKAFQRGTKWGWWVCKACKKPTKAWGNYIPVVIGNSIDLMKVMIEEIKMDPDDGSEEANAKVAEASQQAVAEQAHTANEVAIVGIHGTSRGVTLHG